jgi:MoaA/NifB/PqqE/SkfB family radical SAM enzyme
MCERHSKFAAKIRKNRIMPFEIIEKTIAETAPFGLREIIPSTMGEPLLYKDFDKILDLCRKNNIKLNLTTNGSFPHLGAKKWAELIVPLTCDVKISYNGATKETYESIMQENSWEKSLQNTKDFIAIREEHFKQGGNYCRVTFQLTFMERNVKELPDMVKLAIDLGVDRIKGHHIWVNFDEMKNENMRRNSDSIKRWNDVVKKTLEVANGKNIVLQNIFEIKESTDGELIQNSICPFLEQEAWFNTDGDFSPCCAPDELRKTLGKFGNITEKTFFEIWESREYKKLCENYKTIMLCKKCNMRRAI